LRLECDGGLHSDGGFDVVPRYVRLDRDDREQSAERDTQQDFGARCSEIQHLRAALRAARTHRRLAPCTAD